MCLFVSNNLLLVNQYSVLSFQYHKISTNSINSSVDLITSDQRKDDLLEYSTGLLGGDFSVLQVGHGGIVISQTRDLLLITIDLIVELKGAHLHLFILIGSFC
jgi:hypothetical protein